MKKKVRHVVVRRGRYFDDGERRDRSIFNYQMISISLYTSFQLISNILSTKITVLPVIGLAIDAGTIIYPLTFTLRDFVHKSCGRANARKLVFLAAGLNLAMFFFFWIAGQMPSDSSWQNQKAYDAILLPVWRIVLASVAASLIAELIDTEIFHVFYKRVREYLGVFVSNSVALVFDSFIFSFLAFSGTMPADTVLQIAISNIIIKFILTVLSVPAIKFIPRMHE